MRESHGRCKNDQCAPMWVVCQGNERHTGSAHTQEEEARWENNVRSAAEQIVRHNVDDDTFARMLILTLTQEIERQGGFPCQKRTAFYTDVTACLAAKASKWCSK